VWTHLLVGGQRHLGTGGKSDVAEESVEVDGDGLREDRVFVGLEGVRETEDHCASRTVETVVLCRQEMDVGWQLWTRQVKRERDRMEREKERYREERE
jgi:hypothetical protein